MVGYQAIYRSRNLAGHDVSAECNPAGETNCPCDDRDVALRSLLDHGEVISNVGRRLTYVNAIGYRKFLETLPDGAPIRLGTYCYAGEFGLPIVPEDDPDREENGQAVHLMIQLWDGREALFSSGGMSLEGVIYWAINPWRPSYGHVQVYTGAGSPVLVESGLVLPPDLAWHSFELVVDLDGRCYRSVTIDGQTADLDELPLARVAQPGWGPEVSLVITTESLAAWPESDCSRVFTWTTRFRNLTFAHRRT
jgi:hypothetical protein